MSATILFILFIVQILIELRLIKYFIFFEAENLGKLLVCINCIPFPVDVADSILRPFFYRDVKINAIFISPVVYIYRVLQYAHIPEASVPIQLMYILDSLFFILMRNLGSSVY